MRLFICQFCSNYSTNNFRRLCNHYAFVHPHNLIICNINSCKSKYNVVRSFVRHIKKNHRWFWDEHWNNSSQSAGGSESRDSDNDNDRDEDVFEPMFFDIPFENETGDTFAEVPVNTILRSYFPHF